MFDSLDEQIDTTEGARHTTGERVVRFFGMAVVAVLVFAGLYLGIVALQ